MTYAGLIELLERLKANAEEHGRHRDVIELDDAVKWVRGVPTRARPAFSGEVHFVSEDD